MTAIDRAALIKVTAQRLHRIDCDCPEPDEPDHSVDYGALVEDSLPIITREMIAPLSKLHHEHWHSPRTCVNYGACQMEGKCSACGRKYPCPTVRLLDQIEAEMGGNE